VQAGQGRYGVVNKFVSASNVSHSLLQGQVFLPELRVLVELRLAATGEVQGVLQGLGGQLVLSTELFLLRGAQRRPNPVARLLDLSHKLLHHRLVCEEFLQQIEPSIM